jgi:hypothetical protein
MTRPHPGAAALLPGDHLCRVFDDEDEYLDAIAAYLREGLEAGQRVVHFVDEVRLGPVDASLARHGVDAGAAGPVGSCVRCRRARRTKRFPGLTPS